ncbi:hypothetical protein JG687_00007361, partial [Phytophthora cactorum]
NSDFTDWVKYVDDLNAKHPEEPKFVVRSLRKYFADDYILTMTQSAKSVEGTRGIATKVEDDLLRVWLYSQKTPDDALGAIGHGEL